MANDPRREDPGKDRVKSGKAADKLAERLRDLDARLDRHQGERLRKDQRRTDSSGFGAALRLSTEFVSAVLVGAGIGWAIDRFFGVGPWAMIFFLLLGFCAGVVTVLRSAGRLSDPHGSARKDEPEQDAGRERE
jgi:ATP synthase protein I